MRPVAQHRIEGITLEIHRPLLGIWREEIDAYLAGHRLIFREDPSNCDPRHTRNRIRHEILPLLRAVMGREVRAAIWRAAEIVSAEDAFLAGLLEAEDGAPELALSAVRDLPLAMQRRVIRAWLQANGVPEIAFADVENVRSLVEGGPAKVNLASAAHARRRAGRLFLEWPPGTTGPRTGGRKDLCD
jgi:tRNA(Ile)-lysidine synthase